MKSWNPEPMREWTRRSETTTPPAMCSGSPRKLVGPLIQSQARQQTNGATIDQAMTAIERDNPDLRGVLPKDYGRDALDKQRLGRGHRPGQQHQGWRSRCPGNRRPGESVRVLPGAVRHGGGPEGWRILHPPLGGPASGGNDRALPGAGSTTHAAVPPECSSSPSGSSKPTQQGTATEEGPGTTCPSTGRSPTRPPGAWPE